MHAVCTQCRNPQTEGQNVRHLLQQTDSIFYFPWPISRRGAERRARGPSLTLEDLETSISDAGAHRSRSYGTFTHEVAFRTIVQLSVAHPQPRRQPPDAVFQMLSSRRGGASDAVCAPFARRANSWPNTGSEPLTEAEDETIRGRALHGPPVYNGFIYLKMEGKIGHTLPTPVGTHFSWLFWGRSRLAIFCAATRISDAVRRAVRIFPLTVPKARPAVVCTGSAGGTAGLGPGGTPAVSRPSVSECPATRGAVFPLPAPPQPNCSLHRV